jgi:CheY-like chemotaxis protein
MVGEKVMIVDDNKAFLSELEEILVSCGYDVKIVTKSANAFEAARRTKPQVILLDLKMDEVNGFQVAEKLKNSPDTAGIPIIAMSGYFPVEQPSALLDMSNMESRIKKPFAILDLISQIEAVLNINNSGILTEPAVAE